MKFSEEEKEMNDNPAHHSTHAVPFANARQRASAHKTIEAGVRLVVN